MFMTKMMAVMIIKKTYLKFGAGESVVQTLDPKKMWQIAIKRRKMNVKNIRVIGC